MIIVSCYCTEFDTNKNTVVSTENKSYVCDETSTATALMNGLFQQLLQSCSLKATKFPAEIKSLKFYRPSSNSIIVEYEKFTKDGVNKVSVVFNLVGAMVPIIIKIDEVEGIIKGGKSNGTGQTS